MTDGFENSDGLASESMARPTVSENSNSERHLEPDESLREQLEFEQLLSELSAAFVNIPGDKLDEEIRVWLQRIGTRLELDFCTVWQVAEDGVNFDITHIHSLVPLPGFPSQLQYSAFMYAARRLFHREALVFSSVEDLPTEADNEKQIIRAIGLKSTAVFPLAVGESYIGAVTFGTMVKERAWPESLLRRLRMVGEIIANALVLRRSQEALRRERDRAQQYLDIAGTILVALDREARVTMVNQKGCQLLGYDESEIIGKDWFDTCVPPAIRADVRATFPPLMDGKREPSPYYENAVLTKSGEERLIAWNNVLLRDDHGAIVGTLSSGEDITERRHAEVAVRDSEARFRAIYEGSPIAIEIYDRQGRLIDVNRACIEMFGISGAYDVRGFSLLDDPNLSPEVRDKLRRGESVRCEMTFDFDKVRELSLYSTTKSGVIYLDVEMIPLLLEFGESSVGYLVQIQDITERKQAEEAMMRERDRAQEYFDTVETIIVALDREGVVTSINRKGCQLLGYGEGELIGKSWFQTCLPQPDGMGAVYPIFLKIIAGEMDTVEYLENPIITRSGELRHIAWHNALLRDGEGRIIGTLSSGNDITERKRAEEQLRESEERYRSLVDTAAIGITMISPQMEVLSINNQFAQWFPRVDVSQRPICYKVFNDPPRDHVCTYCPVVKTLADGKAHESVTHTPAGGTIRNYHIVSSPVFDANGKVSVVIETVEDVTERRQALDALKFSEEKLAKVFQSSPALISISSLNDNSFTEVNDAFLETLGFKREEVIGRSVADLNIFVDPQTRDQIVNGVRERGFVRGLPVRVRTRSGNVLDGLLSAESIEVRDHKYLLSVATDITEQRRMERALRESKERFERVTQESREMVWEVDVNGLFTYVNPACEEILGYRPDEMIGKMHFYDLHPEQDREEFKRGSFRQIACGESFHNSVNKVVAKDGRDVWFLTSGAPLYDESGNLKGYMGADLDITERRHAEQALRESEEKFLKAFNSSPAMMAISTIEDGRLIEVNEAFLSILGFKREEVINKSTLDLNVFADPSDRELIKKAIRERGSVNSVDARMRLRSGEVRDCLFSAEIIELGGMKYLLSFVTDVTERKRFNTMLRFAVEGTSAATGKNFFRSMVKHLATALEVRYAMVGEINRSEPSKVTSVAVWAGEKIGKNFVLNLANGPCADIFEHAACLCPDRLRELYPHADMVSELGLESVLAMPLTDSSGRPLGILAVMDVRPLPETMIPHAQSLVSIFAARAAAELERHQVEEELRRTSENLLREREELSEKNIALKQVLDHLEKEKTEYRHEIAAGVENMISPFVRKLQAASGYLAPKDLAALANAVESIIGKNLDRFLNNYAKLTPRERDICELIKKGRTSKQIAEKLNIDVLTVHKHRDSIRRKLQLKHKGLNLTSYLRSK